MQISPILRTKPNNGFTLLALGFGLLLLTGCGVRGADAGDSGGQIGSSVDSPADGAECELPAMRQWVEGNMRDYYLFYDQLPSVDLSNYDSVESLVSDLRVQPFDRYSGITDAATSSALFEEGRLFGFGMRLVRTSATDVLFSLLHPGSPLDQAGIERGDFLRAINGIDINLITAEQWDLALGTNDSVVTPTFTIQSPGTVERDVAATKAEYTLQTVLETSVVEHAGLRVGYLHFLSFLETSSAELETAFDFLEQQNIDELVLDLRYNGGGRIVVGNELASRIVGSAADNSDFSRFAYNDKYNHLDQSFPFYQLSDSLNLPRVFVLTTASTCSASEMVINGLRPFMEVITVGNTSCGKPYGTLGRTRCGKVMHALEVEFVNDSGVGAYYNGISADCPIDDNPADTLGSAQEALLGAALEYITTGSCSLVAADATAQMRTRNNKPGIPLLPGDDVSAVFDR